MRVKVDQFINSELGKDDFKGDLKENKGTMTGPTFPTPNSAKTVTASVSKGENLAVSHKIDCLVNPCREVSPFQFDLSFNSGDSGAKFGGGEDYFKGGNQRRQYQFSRLLLVSSVPLVCSVSLCQGKMASSTETGSGQEGAAAPSMLPPRASIIGAVSSDGTEVCEARGEELPSSSIVEAAPGTPLMEKGKATMGGPSGLALTVTLNAAFGFTAAPAPPPLRRNGKSKAAMFSRMDNKPIVIDMEAALRAVASKLAAARVLSSYPVDPKVVVNELRGPWRLRGEAMAQRLTSDDRRFVITFAEGGDRHHVLHVGPWHFRNDVVILAAFDGDGNPADVCLDSIKLWAQIWGLPVPIKTVKMGYILGDKLGKVLAVGHRNKKIVDDHLHVRVEHLIDEPLRKTIDTTPVGN